MQFNYPMRAFLKFGYNELYPEFKLVHLSINRARESAAIYQSCRIKCYNEPKLFENGVERCEVETIAFTTFDF